MSFQALLIHKCEVQRSEVDLSSGSAELTWKTVKPQVSFYLDLLFLRTGKDPVWTPEAARPSERAGVAFFHPRTPIRNGDRIKVIKGPAQGSYFTLEMAIDEAWRPNGRHHLECYVRSLPSQITDVPYDER